MKPSARLVHRTNKDGWVQDWLASSAWKIDCSDLDQVIAPDGSPWDCPNDPQGRLPRWSLTNGPDVAPLKTALYNNRPLIADSEVAVEAIPGMPIPWLFGPQVCAGATANLGQWHRVHADAEGLVDWSDFCDTPQYQMAAATCCLEVDQAEWREFVVATTSPIAVWIDGQLVAQYTEFTYMEPLHYSLRLRLESGLHQVVIASWQVAFREVRQVIGLRVVGLPLRVITAVEVAPNQSATGRAVDEFVGARHEQILAAISLDNWATTSGQAVISGPPGVQISIQVIDDPSLGTPNETPLVESIFNAEGKIEVALSQPADHIQRFNENAALRVHSGPLMRDIPVCLGLDETEYRAQPVGSPSQWRSELLTYAARLAPGIPRSLAQGQVEYSDVVGALKMVRERWDCADFQAIGLLNLLHHIDPADWEPGLREEIRTTLLGFKYWIDQPGLDAMCYFTENHQFVWHVAEYLAGSAFPEESFFDTQTTGSERANHGRTMALAWMRRKLSGGFAEFDSNAYAAINCLSLASLIQMAPEEEIRRTAINLLNLLLIQLGAHSWKGIHASPHGRSYVRMLRSARFEETGPIQWFLWGQGSLNADCLPAMVLALTDRFPISPVLRGAAQLVPGGAFQAHRGQYSFQLDLLDRPYGSDVYVWRTEGAALSSAQDYRAGAAGLQEHIWGATLGPETRVFATNPGALSPSARPGAWSGQRVLPRVRQFEDTVLVLHQETPTHLWFPAANFDEVIHSGSWIGGRVGNGLVAVATEGGFRPQESGAEAWQEWHPVGAGAWYVATVSTGEDLEAFVASLGEPVFGWDGGEPKVDWPARALSLSWSGPLIVDGKVSSIPLQRILRAGCVAEFGQRIITMDYADHSLEVDCGR